MHTKQEGEKSGFVAMRAIIVICIVVVQLTILTYINPSPLLNASVKSYKVSLFHGLGTEKSPFLIESREDLEKLRDCVNEGTDFKGVYFYQTKNIDLGADTIWVPIGEFASGKYFYGIYDGGAHHIDNLNCKHGDGDVSNMGLFGQLGGTVLNLGIESGRIEGDFVGSIASHAATADAAIINCYNCADVIGTGRAGGICDNFGGGLIANCINTGNVDAPQCGAIVSYNAKYVFNVYPQVDPPGASFTGSIVNYTMDSGQLYDQLNRGVDYFNAMGTFEDYELRHWDAGEG